MSRNGHAPVISRPRPASKMMHLRGVPTGVRVPGRRTFLAPGKSLLVNMQEVGIGVLVLALAGGATAFTIAQSARSTATPRLMVH